MDLEEANTGVRFMMHMIVLHEVENLKSSCSSLRIVLLVKAGARGVFRVHEPLGDAT